MPMDSNQAAPAAGAWSGRGARWLLALVFAAGLALRLVGLSQPPYDSHGFRQTQTLGTIEIFHAEGIDLLHPKTIYMGWPGTFVLELPVFQATAAALYGVFGAHIEIVRLVNIACGFGAAWLLFRLVARLLNRAVAGWAVVVFWLAPLNILYQRSMLLDPMAVCFALLACERLAALLVPDEAGRKNSTWSCFAVFALATLVTALIKALYLWPAVLLVAQQFFARRGKLDAPLVRVGVVFALAGAAFVAWNLYAIHINDASPFTRNVKPTTLLGISAWFSPEFYWTLLMRRPKWWLGLPGVLLYPAGLWVVWRQRNAAAWLLVLIPPTYLLAFANVNLPHDYYQLIITPFLAVVPALALDRWCGRRTNFAWAAGLVGIGAAAFMYLAWKHQPQVEPELLRLERLCAGKLSPGKSAMVFVGQEKCGGRIDSYIPEFIYAARQRGYGRSVADANGGARYFRALAGAFPHLDYVICFGTESPGWLPKERFEPLVTDAAEQLYIFQRREKP